jgi:hypothetical protein
MHIIFTPSLFLISPFAVAASLDIKKFHRNDTTALEVVSNEMDLAVSGVS